MRSECTACGAAMEGGSKFCNRCGEPVPDELDEGGPHDVDDARLADEVARVGRAPAGTSGPGPGAKIAGFATGLALIVFGIFRLMNRPSVELEVIEAPDVGYGMGATPTELPRDRAADRAPTGSERALAGTWVARVGFDAPRPAAMGATLVEIQALRAGLAQPLERCIWLELYANLRGFQHECGVVGGEPSVLQRTDPVTGGSSPLGVAFRWSFEDGRLAITYDEDMVVSAGGRTTRFVETTLALPQGSPPFDVQQSFPEHPEVPPLALRFEVFAGSYLGDEPQGE